MRPRAPPHRTTCAYPAGIVKMPLMSSHTRLRSSVDSTPMGAAKDIAKIARAFDRAGRLPRCGE